MRAVVDEPVLFPDGGNDGTSGTLRATTGCHDITVYQAIDLAAGACTGQGVIIDISDPVNPKVLELGRGHELRVLAQRHDQPDGKRSCSRTRRAAARARSATRRSARSAARTRSTTSPTRPTRGS